MDSPTNSKKSLFSALIVIVGAALVGALVAGLLAGCGGSDGSSSSSSTTEQTDTSTKPVVTVPSGDPPTDLVSKDIVVGKGPTAEKGDLVSVQYVGVDYDTGEEFDASWDRGQSFPFVIGSGQVIPGWDQGVTGMKVGGRRELIIPPDLAYGKQGAPPDIGPDETLVFVIDLLDLKKDAGT